MRKILFSFSQVKSSWRWSDDKSTILISTVALLRFPFLVIDFAFNVFHLFSPLLMSHVWVVKVVEHYFHPDLTHPTWLIPQHSSNNFHIANGTRKIHHQHSVLSQASAIVSKGGWNCESEKYSTFTEYPVVKVCTDENEFSLLLFSPFFIVPDCWDEGVCRQSQCCRMFDAMEIVKISQYHKNSHIPHCWLGADSHFTNYKWKILVLHLLMQLNFRIEYVNIFHIGQCQEF